MLRTVSFWQHLLVGLAIALMTILAGVGVIGAGDESVLRPEFFVAKQVTVSPDGGDGVTIREVVDVDFGVNERHGYERTIPNDFGVPTGVTATSPDADATVTAVTIGDETRIRLGDPNTTYTGRHRYVLEYALPDANVSSGRLDLDIIGNDETFETRRFEVVLTGFDFDSLECFVGDFGSFGDCRFDRGDSDDLVAVIAPLAPGDGISVSGAIASLTSPAMPPIPIEPAGTSFRLQPLGLVMIPVGLLAAGAVFLIGRRAGSNTVMSGGAADAAYGDLPVPGDNSRRRDVGTSRVPDSRLAELATVEFVPPRGLEPWQAAVVLGERVDNDTVGAWFAELIADDALVATKHDDEVWLTRGDNAARLSAIDQGHLQRLFADDDVVKLGTYDKEFTAVWSSILDEQRSFARTAGWWDSGGPGGSITTPSKVVAAVVAVLAVLTVVLVIAALATSTAFWRVVAAPWLAVVAGFLVPFVVAAIAYRGMYASRTATGSALALRAESFRRFLVASEGKHVEWAWKQGLVREYSAWAVALGAADAWSRAVQASNIPDAQVALAGPLLVHSSASAFTSSMTAPSSSGGGGGFSGGGVGGGGGGGSSGSW